MLQSPLAHILPFSSGIPDSYWKNGLVPKGSILITGSPPVDDEYLYMLVHSPNLGTVSYTGDLRYPQFSETSLGSIYRGQCAAFAKVVSGMTMLSTENWKKDLTLEEFAKLPESLLPSSSLGLMIAYFDGKVNYKLADPARKHVAILIDIVRDSKRNPIGITVVDQNYYNFGAYAQYTGRIARHIIPWGKVGQKGVGFARSYHIVTI